ncbi:MAG: hypothetical protein FD180_2846 [Planctomycetota bacterium]|nr:MAG: hypothetical protein FD180_2846 [Planctomycetota bacterium]
MATSSQGADVKLFTREEADKTLPLVRVIVRDIVTDYDVYTKKQQELNAITARMAAKPTKDDLRFQQTLEDEVGVVKKRIAEAAMELEKLGIEIKDCQLGLVDFPAKVSGDIAYLCWKFDEAKIAFWHGLSEGFTGRKPLT